MLKRPRSLVLLAACLLLAGAAAAHAAATAGKWKGQATSIDGKFKYGKVTFRVKGSTMRDIKIESVTVDGCGGFKTVYLPKAKITGTKFKGAYQPVEGVDDIITINGTISGGKAKGTFHEGPLCQGDGRFTAKATG